jgi:hypothetical protein
MITGFDKTIEEAKAEILPYESWERLTGESSPAYSAFFAFRDFGTERNIRKAVETVESNISLQAKKYNGWRNWAVKFRWRERAADYDRYIEKLKQGELRKTIEAQGEQHRQVTGKMLEVAKKKLDLMDANELTQSNLNEWGKQRLKRTGKSQE